MPKEFSKINPLKLGIAGGIASVLFVVISTIITVYTPLEANGFVVLMYRDFGYSNSLLGIIIGAFCAFFDSFVTAYIIAFIYNKIL